MPNRENITDTSTTSATAGILIRSDGAPGNADRNHYYLGIYPGQDLWKLFRKTTTDGWQLIDSDDMTIDLDRYYTLSASAQGDTISICLDGTLLKALDESGAGNRLTSGHVGLRVRNATARFDDVRAEGLSYNAATSYIYNEATGALMHELDASGQITKTYMSDEEGNPLAVAIRQPDGSFKTFYYHTDAHGDVVAITDQNGEIVARFSYDPWGVPTEYDASGNIVEIGSWAGSPSDGLFFLFGGMLYDALAGLYLTKTRTYNPKTGRFLERDILDEVEKGLYKGFPFGRDAIGTNLYAWCKNNPVNRIDPSGEWFVSWYKKQRARVALNRFRRIFRFSPKPSTGRGARPIPNSYGDYVYSGKSGGRYWQPWTRSGSYAKGASLPKPPPKVTAKVANITVSAGGYVGGQRSSSNVSFNPSDFGDPTFRKAVEPAKISESQLMREARLVTSLEGMLAGVDGMAGSHSQASPADNYYDLACYKGIQIQREINRPLIVVVPSFWYPFGTDSEVPLPVWCDEKGFY